MMQINKELLIQKTLKLLEFNTILERVASRSMSEEASQIIKEESPCPSVVAVAKIKKAVQAIVLRLNSGENDPRRYLPAIGFLLPKLSVEGIALELDEVCAIGLFLERGGELRKWLSHESMPEDMLGEIQCNTHCNTQGGMPAGCEQLAATIFRIIDKEGNLRDLPELRAIRQRISRLKSALDTAIARYLGDEETRRMLQSTLPSQRDGRTVLAVKANFRGRVRGIVHEVSSTGQTVFIEPENVVEKNNDILVETRNLEAEIKKILLNLTKQIAEHGEEIKSFHLTVLKMEVLMAKARYSLESSGFFTPSDGAGFAFVQARHPLLEKAVPIDISMDKGEGTRALIITGPNTGGKTVVLKTVGLLAMMNQIGLAIPAAEGSDIPVFDNIFADIGDEQSISQSLSTFSAHITNVAAIITHSTENSLALLDELGSGTDPQEGGAIAMAVLDRLIEKKTRLLITTHHGVLKNYGYTREEVENASVEFDSRTLSPTYRIITGIPGESRALEIAGRNGLPGEIIERAKSYLDDGRSDISEMISGLKEKHRELDGLEQKMRLEEDRLKDERRKSDLKELRLRQKELELKAGHAGKLRLLLDESRKTLENLVRELKEGAASSQDAASPKEAPSKEGGLSREQMLKVKGFLNELAQTVEAENAVLDEEERAVAKERRRADNSGESVTSFAPGMEVLAGESKRRGVIVRLDKKTAAGNTWIVEIGSLKISFSEQELVPAASTRGKPQPVTAQVDWAEVPVARAEINLCGMRLEEALEALRKQTEASMLCGLKTFAVIHGKGEGILQRGVHEWLKKDPFVEDYYFSHPELGGFGRTEVVLK
ncbi:MAG: endonuclease MutS2 [Treponema sp.]|nr:endonuclease MutS2 [Treponema sp.]